MGVVVMASTNDINSMDEALINRPGRFDVKIEIPLPDENDRARMLSEFLKKFHAKPDKSITNEAWTNAIRMTDGLTGAYMKDLAKSVVIRSVAAGRCQNNSIQFSSDDLIGSAEQILKNFSIGKKAVYGDGSDNSNQ
jgi:ATP-dependent 26S proteasome regulatory subunit